MLLSSALAVTRSERLLYRWRVLLTVLQLQAAYVALRLFSFRRVHSLFATPVKENAAFSRQYALALLESAVWRFPWLDTCLPRALITNRLLRAAGVRAEIEIGVHPGAELKAHAWVKDESGQIYQARQSEPLHYHRLIDEAKN